MDASKSLWALIQVLIQVMLLMWPVTLALATNLLIRLGMYIYKSHRLAKSGIADIDKMSGEDFERYLEIFFSKQGYQVRRTPYQGDYGADLILRQGNEKTIVQAKRYKRKVGVKAVQEAVASKEYYRCDKTMVVTNSYFTRQAQTLAKANLVELWDRDTLVSRLLSGMKTGSLEFASSAEAFDSGRIDLQPVTNSSTTPTCAKCGKPVSTKVQDYCLSHSDVFSGLIYCFDHQKEIRRFHPAR